MFRVSEEDVREECENRSLEAHRPQVRSDAVRVEAESAQHLLAGHGHLVGKFRGVPRARQGERSRVTGELVHHQRLVPVIHEGEPRDPSRVSRDVVLVEEEPAEEDGDEETQRRHRVGHRDGLGRRADGHAHARGAHVRDDEARDEVGEAVLGALVETDHAVGDEPEKKRREDAHREDVEQERRREVGVRAVHPAGALAQEEQPIFAPHGKRTQAHQRQVEQHEEQGAHAVLNAPLVAPHAEKNSADAQRRGERRREVHRQEERVPTEFSKQTPAEQTNLFTERGDVRLLGRARVPATQGLESRRHRRRGPSAIRAVLAVHVRVLLLRRACQIADVRFVSARHVRSFEIVDHPHHVLLRASKYRVQHVICHVHVVRSSRRVRKRREVRLRRRARPRIHRPPRPGHHQHAIQQPEDVRSRLVDAHHHGHAHPPERGEDVHHLGGVGAVQAGGGLVQEHDSGVRQELGGDGDAAFLTAAEPAGELIADERVRHLDQPELTHPPRGAPVEIRVVRLIRQSKHGVEQQMFPHRRRPGEDVVLRDVSADVAHLATIHQSPVDAHATVRHLSLRRATGQVIQQRRLTRAARTENRKQTRSRGFFPDPACASRGRGPRSGETRHPAEDTPDHPGRTRGRDESGVHPHVFPTEHTRASRRRRVAYDDVVRRPGPASARSEHAGRCAHVSGTRTIWRARGRVRRLFQRLRGGFSRVQ